MKKIFVIFTFMLSFMGCNTNEFTIYNGKFVFFDTSASDVISINELGEFTGTYYVHYSGETAKERFAITYEVIPGDGLVEGRDYEMVTSGRTLNFMPGVFSLPIRINWKPNEIDETKDNTLTLRLKSGPDGITLGYPGPAQNNKQLIITKYKN